MKADVRCFTCQLDGLVRAMIERDLPRERIEQTTKEYLAYLSTFDMQACAAEVARQSWRWRVRALDDSDSLRAMKREHNRAMLENYDVFYEQVMQQPDPLEAAIKLAAAGNVMDACMDHGMSMRDTVLEALSIQLAQNDVQAFKQVLQRSQRVLLLCDNCGEIVLDKLLLQVLFDLELTAPDRVSAVVRGKVVLNDATMEDAVAVGLCDMVRVIDNGDDSPGVQVETSSEAFVKELKDADLIISKGQGNLEGLSDYPGILICYMLMAKCAVAQDALGLPAGSTVCLLRRQ